MMQTTYPKQETARRDWYAASAKGQVLGRLATRIAVALMGKAKPTWHPSVDQGDFVVVTDVEAIAVTRDKARKKTYRFHTGYIGGLHELSFERLHERNPEEVIRLAVRRMLPKNVQGTHMLRRLKLYRGSAHPHGASSPKQLP